MAKNKFAKFFSDYFEIIGKYSKKYSNLFKTGSLLFITLISGIYINLFTNTLGSSYAGIHFTLLGETWFSLGFGLIALISFLQAIISLFMVGVVGLISTVVIYFVYRTYRYFLKRLYLVSKPLVLFILTLCEFGIALIVLLHQPFSLHSETLDLIKEITAFLILLMGFVNLKFFEKGINMRKRSKIYNPKRTLKKMEKIDPASEKTPLTKKEWLALLIVGLLSALVTFILSVSLTPLAGNQNFLWNLIQVSAIISGFGFLTFQIKPKEVSFFHTEFKKDLRSVSLWGLISMIFAFACMPLLSTSSVAILDLLLWATLLSLLYSLVLLFLIVLYYPYKLD